MLGGTNPSPCPSPYLMGRGNRSVSSSLSLRRGSIVPKLLHTTRQIRKCLCRSAQQNRQSTISLPPDLPCRWLPHRRKGVQAERSPRPLGRGRDTAERHTACGPPCSRPAAR